MIAKPLVRPSSFISVRKTVSDDKLSLEWAVEDHHKQSLPLLETKLSIGETVASKIQVLITSLVCDPRGSARSLAMLANAKCKGVSRRRMVHQFHQLVWGTLIDSGRVAWAMIQAALHWCAIPTTKDHAKVAEHCASSIREAL